MMRKIVAVNDKGIRIGEHHPHAKLSNADVDRIRELREDEGKTYAEISRVFNVPKSTVSDICKYRRRAQTPSRWKTVKK